MCGICGYIVKDPKKIKEAQWGFGLTLVGNENRGSDSTGVYCTDGKDEYLFKDIKPSTELTASILDNMPPYSFGIGHTRMPTVGAVTPRNAHPLPYEGVYMVHNGCVWNHTQIARKHGWKPKHYQVDSEVLLPYILKRNWQAIADDATSAAILAIDTNTNEFLIYRKNNPLFMLEVDGYTLFSSREQELEIAKDMFWIGNEIASIPEGEQITINMTSLESTKQHIQETEILKPWNVGKKSKYSYKWQDNTNYCSCGAYISESARKLSTQLGYKTSYCDACLMSLGHI